MPTMIEAAAPIRSEYSQEGTGWIGYVFGCIIGLTGFCGMLWLAS